MKRLLVAGLVVAGIATGCSPPERQSGPVPDDDVGFVAQNEKDANAQCERWQQSSAVLKQVKQGEDVADRIYVDENKQPLVVCAR